MWYVLNYDKFDHITESDDEGRASDSWRKKWLTRMERREYVVAFRCTVPTFILDRVLVQILLYMLKLSLPAQPQLETSPRKRKRKGRTDTDEPANSLTPEDILESFMDKLSAWQHVQNLEPVASTKDDLDWMQTFCQHVLEPQFVPSRPCAVIDLTYLPDSNQRFLSFASSSVPKSSRHQFSLRVLRVVRLLPIEMLKPQSPRAQAHERAP